jgi:hypothetical protein
MRFENPANGYVEEVTNAPLWCLLFGCIYFAVKGVWTHAVAALLLALVTFCISWLVYPFFATQIMRTHYLRRGWVEINAHQQEPIITGMAPARSTVGRNVLLGFLLFFVAAAVAGMWSAATQDKAGKPVKDEVRQVVAAKTVAPDKAAAPSQPVASAQNQPPRKTVVTASSDVPKPEPRDRNEANKRLMALSEADRRTFLYVILNMSKEPCAEVTRTFYKGSAKPSWNAIWNVACRGGPSYSILIFSDEKGSSKVMTCGELRSVGGGECFTRTE